MNTLIEKDRELIAAAREAISKNYDGKDFLHTVGAALRAKSEKIYVGVK